MPFCDWFSFFYIKSGYCVPYRVASIRFFIFCRSFNDYKMQSFSLKRWSLRQREWLPR